MIAMFATLPDRRYVTRNKAAPTSTRHVRSRTGEEPGEFRSVFCRNVCREMG